MENEELIETPLDDHAASEVAVIGFAGRFPGARNTDEFWQNLRDGVESISFFTQEELQTLAPLVAAVRWETAKILAPGRLPDVPYDSPEHRAFMASVPGDESS